MEGWRVSRADPNVTLLETEYERNAQWEQWVFLCSDLHIDSIHCQQELLKRHLDQAVERNAPIIVVGDLLDVMGMKMDPRTRPKHIREFLKEGNYLDQVTKYAVDFLKPYAKNLALVSDGNHEKNISKRHETDILQRIVDLLNYTEGTSIQKGRYSGYGVFRFTRKGSNEKHRTTLYYHHGAFGGMVTKGVLGVNRRAGIVDADIIATGHIHEKWHVVHTREYLDYHLTPVLKDQDHICLGTYQDAYDHSGWADQKGFSPKPMGGWWLRFFCAREATKHGTSYSRMDWDVIMAK